jgi:hypothetical protein
MNIEYFIDSKKEYDIETIKDLNWDIFISCYNNSERVKKIFSTICAKDKLWIITPEYEYVKSEYPNENYLEGESFNEAELILGTIGKYLKDKNHLHICIDITGFMRPHIIFLVKYMKLNNISNYDLIYSEPSYYAKKSDTSFTESDVNKVRQISNFEGSHHINTANDVLIIGVGYDHNLVSRVILNKDQAHLIFLFGLPSLSADMYQESILRFNRVSADSKKISNENTFFSSVNDPFVNASVLSNIYKYLKKKQEKKKQKEFNLYLCPLSTKPQALGFALFYMKELQNEAASIIFPFSSSYSKNTSIGIGRIWLYPIHL